MQVSWMADAHCQLLSSETQGKTVKKAYNYELQTFENYY